jgi:hypothetical protein
VDQADSIEAEQAVHEHDRQGRAARRLARDRNESFERPVGRLHASCDTPPQRNPDCDEQQERDQDERRGHGSNLSQHRCGKASQVIDAIVCRGGLSRRNLASLRGIMVKATSHLSKQGAMPRFIFPEWTETFKKWVNLLALGAPIYLIALIAYGVESPEALRIGYEPEQPVPYSHALHAGELGIDCRYCHTTVERAAKAAIPPAATCMNCHSQVKKDSDLLMPIRQAFAENTPVKWTRVHDLPDYVYFNHMAHVNAAIGCETCHGRIDQMSRVYQAKALTMSWCIDCHKNPTPYLRDPENITKMGYDDEKSTPHRMPGEGERIAKKNDVHPPMNCSTCHR